MSDEKHAILSPKARTAGIVCLTAAGIVIAAILLLCAATWLLTPERLTEIINREASENLKADVNVRNARFTLWSTFPHFCIETDSITVVSRTLRNLSPHQRSLLPDNCDSLASAKSMKGGINIIKLISGKFFLKDMEVSGLSINLAVLNDSINNYSIFPESGDDGTIPYFTADRINLRDPHRLRYYSDATKTHIDLDLSGASMTRRNAERDSYDLKLTGNISAKVKDLNVLKRFPFELDGTTKLKFNPFNISLENYNVNLGNTKGNLNMDLDLGEKMKVNNFIYRINAFNLVRLMRYFPGESFPYLSRINADITVNATARLTNPYRFSASSLPSLEVDFNIPDGNIEYTVNENEMYSLRHTGMRGSLLFDGDNPDSSYFDIPQFLLEGDGMAFGISGRITDLTGNSPYIKAHIDARSDLATTGNAINAIRDLGLKGELTADADIGVRIANLSDGDLKNIGIKGNARLSGFRFSDRESKTSAQGKSLSLSFRSDIAALTERNIHNGSLSFNIGGDGINADIQGYRIDAPRFTAGCSLSDNISFNLSALNAPGKPAKEVIPFDMKLNAISLKMHDQKDSVKITAGNMNIGGHIDALPYKGAADSFDLDVSGEKIQGAFNGTVLSLHNVNASLSSSKAGKEKNGTDTYRQSIPVQWNADSVALRNVAHSPEYITAELPDNIRELMNSRNLHASLMVASGTLTTPSIPIPLDFRRLDLATDIDSVILRGIEARLGTSAMKAKGSVSGLRRFLNTSSPVPLKADLDIDIDTLSINRLARAYEKRKRNKTGNPGNDTEQLSCTTACLIPRNIYADIHASADMTRYMNLRLYDLSAGVHVRDGRADIDSLRISADFGHAFLNASYDTSDIRKIGITADLGIEQVDVTGFFRNFHSLLLMMPQMKNLSGFISAQCKGKVLVFPSMYVDIPSLTADINIQGRELNVRQNNFIRHITKMMLLPDSRDIAIKNMDVHASIHDNLLELYPFNFEFEKYRLSMGGVNNFNGKLYYHIGVEKSPVPFPFGINIVNYFHHPKLKFGGASYKIGKGEEITSSVMESNRLNLVKEVKRYMKEFIHKAAESPSRGN